MSEITAEQFAHRIAQCQLLETRQIDEAFAEVGGRDAPLERFERCLIQNELLTNWQIERIREGHRTGYFYGNWKILYMVGAGTFARVYRAAHRRTGDVKAVKVLRKRYVDDDMTRERFEREARTVIKLRHPNIVPIHEVEIDRGRLYMVMDFIEGQNLRDFVRAHRKLKLLTSLHILRDLCSGLSYAYQMGICHRDIKLSNILLSSTGRASLVDFGLARIEEETSQNVFHPRSVDYAGLEKATHVPRDDKRSDIFFVGCILYHMLTGKAPLVETRERMRRMSPDRFKDIVPITSLIPDLPNRVVLLLSHLMELDPEKRIQTPMDALSETNMAIEAIETGNFRKYDKEQSAEDAERFARRLQRKHEGRDHTLMVVESNLKVQDTLRERLKKLGYRVLILGDPARALQRFSQLDPAENKPADCVIFGCAGLGESGIEAFNQFAEGDLTSQVPAILLVPEDKSDLLKHVDLQSHHAAISLPIRFPVIRKTLRKLLNIQKPEVSEDTDASTDGKSDAATTIPRQ